jgi:hypothetical protein
MLSIKDPLGGVLPLPFPAFTIETMALRNLFETPAVCSSALTLRAPKDS